MNPGDRMRAQISEPKHVVRHALPLGLAADSRERSMRLRSSCGSSGALQGPQSVQRRLAGDCPPAEMRGGSLLACAHPTSPPAALAALQTHHRQHRMMPAADFWSGGDIGLHSTVPLNGPGPRDSCCQGSRCFCLRRRRSGGPGEEERRWLGPMQAQACGDRRKEG